MTWNYRVFRKDDGDYVIRKVFYAEDGSMPKGSGGLHRTTRAVGG